MALIDPKSPHGASPWDYGDAIVNELRELKQAIQNASGNNPMLRRLAWSIATSAGGAGQTKLEIPRGKIWVPVAFALSSLTGNLIIGYNDVTDFSTVIWGQGLSLTSNDFKFSTDDRSLPEDQSLVISVNGSAIVSGNITGNVRVLQYDVTDFEPLNAI